MSNRAVLLINCSRGQAARARELAESQRRTISGYVLNIVMRAVEFEEKHLARVERLGPYPIRRPPGPRARVLIRCSAQEAKRIRMAAARRQMTICGYVLYCLERSWKAQGVILDASPE
jgi:hypothetical protein